MNEGPFPFARQSMDLDTMLAAIGGEGWDGLQSKFQPGKVADRFEPDEALKKFVGALYQTGEGRAFFEWLWDLTVRAPPGASGTSMDAAALAHAKHESRFAVGQCIGLAVQQGHDLIFNRKEPPK